MEPDEVDWHEEYLRLASVTAKIIREKDGYKKIVKSLEDVWDEGRAARINEERGFGGGGNPYRFYSLWSVMSDEEILATLKKVNGD